MRVKNLPIRGSIYDIQDSPEKPAPKKRNHPTSNKSPHVNAPPAEGGPSKQRERNRTRNGFVEAEPAIEPPPAGRQTRSKARNVTQNVPPTMPTEIIQSGKAKITPTESAKAPEEAPVTTDPVNQSPSRELPRGGNIPEARQEDSPEAEGEGPELEDDERSKPDEDEWSDYEGGSPSVEEDVPGEEEDEVSAATEGELFRKWELCYEAIVSSGLELIWIFQGKQMDTRKLQVTPYPFHKHSTRFLASSIQ